jgi:hypothetical protein
VRHCAACARELEDDFRFCPGCGAPQRLKLVEHFRGSPRLADGDLRVSAYLTEPRHLRLSVWRRDRVDAVVALDPHETERLASFLCRVAGEARPAERTVARAARALRGAVLRP